MHPGSGGGEWGPYAPALGGPVVFLGVATFDAIALVAELPGSDERTVADDLALAGGGPAATAAVTFARLGLPACFVGTVGDDAEGRQVLAGLRAEGVDTSGVSTVRGRRTGASIVTVEASSGTRTICTRPVPPLHLEPGSVGAGLVRDAAWVHVDHLGWPALLDLDVPPRVKVSLDAGNPAPALDLARVHLYAPTEAGLRRDLGAGQDGSQQHRSQQNSDTRQLLHAALVAGVDTVVATRGGQGCVAASADGSRADVPGTAVDVVSTLGAGDVFHGALLAAVVRGAPLADACSYADTVAALSCRGLDGRSAVPDHATALRHAGLQTHVTGSRS